MLPSELLLKEGWRQGELGGLDGPRCLMGAALDAFPSNAKGSQTYQKFIDECEDLTGDYFGGTAAWNDAPGRTAEEVIALAQEVERHLGLVATEGA